MRLPLRWANFAWVGSPQRWNKAGIRAEQVQLPPDGVVDDVVDDRRPAVKCRYRRKNDGFRRRLP